MPVVRIEQVMTDSVASARSVNKMMNVLERQGQIEPLQVRATGHGSFITFARDPWAAEIVAAAKALGWETLLIVEMKRYEE